MSDNFRVEIETTPVLADEATPPPLSKFSDSLPPPVGATSLVSLPIYIDSDMTSPTIKIGSVTGENDKMGSVEGQGAGKKKTVSGDGLALVDTCVGQDGAYWEWHIGEGDNNEDRRGEDHDDVMVGVSTKRTQDFYKILAESDGAASSLKLATKLMRTVRANPGDTIGVAIDMGAEKPFIKLLLNGELQDEFFLGRFRGSVFPSLWLPKPDGSATATFVVDEASFGFKSPGANFLPLAIGNAKGTSIA